MPTETINTLIPVSTEEQTGLTTTQAEHLLEEYGPNALPEKSPPSSFVIFLAQLKNPLVYVLLGAGLITLFLKEYTDSTIIFLAVFINTILGFVQESKAGKALEALKKLVHPRAKVLRSGIIETIEAEKIVPGDIVILSQGDKIPADGNLIEASRFFASEAILTGESEPVEKKEKDEVYMGTVVTAGTAKMAVTLTGARTEMGKIAISVSEISDDTPLHRQLGKFSKQLSIFVAILIFVIFAVGLSFGKPPVEIFTTSVALAVSAIPEGLLVALTVVLAIGMQRILARKGLVRNLVSAETLGGVTTICADKTGTLTQGKMQVVSVVGEENEIAKQVTFANDLDTSVVIAAWEWGSKKVSKRDKKEFGIQERLDSIPFSSEYKFSASLYPWTDEGNIIFVTGAPDVLLDYSTLSAKEKERIQRRISTLSHEGKRLLAFARKYVGNKKKELSQKDIKTNLQWVGMLAFTDPIRKDVKHALEKTKKAGIKLIVITGDYVETAKTVLKELGLEIKDRNIILGEELDEISEKELAERLADNPTEVKLFARAKPNQKLKIVQTLKKNGEVVAMTGDGVNDAPALSKADIGIVVGEASDVAKETADLVLLDSSFTTIVSAIEEGRGIFDNVRKIILYLMSDAFEEILIVLTSITLGLPVPITAAQILWVNLISDGFPDLALTVDPKVAGSMARPPRPPKEPLVAKWMLKLIVLVSLIGGIFAFALYIYAYKTTGDITFARSVTFATVGLNSLVYVFSIRTLQAPFWKTSFFANKWLIVAVLLGLAFQILPFTTEGLRAFFKLVPLGWYWAAAVAASVLMFFSIEISKWVFRHKLK
jgi:Ca2+-transporting ATPase